MNGEFYEKTVIVTGGARGIGKAIAVMFKAAGANVCVCDIDRAEIDEESAEGFYTKIADVSDEADVNAFMDDVVKTFGNVDILVNNAGIHIQGRLLDMSAADFDRMMKVNLNSVFIMSKAAAKVMIRNGAGGCIINAASFASLLGAVGSGAYAASKAAVYSLTKMLAAELAPYGIRVNGYVPGVIVTPMTVGTIEANRERMLDQIPLRRFGEPSDVANAVAFLASEKAAYLTGGFIEITGGKLCVQSPQAAWG